MSKVIPIILQGKIDSRSTSFAQIWKIVRTDKVVLGFTDHDRDITFEGLVYEARGGFQSKAVQTSSDLAVDNLEIHGLLSSPSITESDIIGGRYDHALVQLAQIDWKNPSAGIIKQMSGYLGKVSTSRAGFSVEVRSLLQSLQQDQGRVYNASCDANLGDARCKVDLTAYTVAGSVMSVSDARNFTVTTSAYADHYFQGGKLTWMTGANAGYGIEVKDSTGAALSIQDGAQNAVQVGDTFSIHAGCDKYIKTCRDKFNNVVNHRGFPFIPGLDRWQAGK